ncbi:MAG: hypothetical protein ACI857_000041 [Arenicella sp.]|jgi:hypothetical protein
MGLTFFIFYIHEKPSCMFGLFKKKEKGAEVVDKIWMDAPARDRGLIQDVKRNLEIGKDVVVLYFFKDSGTELEKFFALHDISSQTNNFHLMNAKDADTSMSTASQLADQLKGNFHLIFTEHYPTKTKEIMVIEAIQNKTPKVLNPYFYISMDSPLMKMFGADRMKKMMASMGTGSNEAIEHSMISKSVERAQRKIEASVANPYDKNSAEEWYKTNCETYKG